MSVPDFLKGPDFDIFRKKDSLENVSHAAFKERLRKTLRYGKTPTFDRPSLPMTELAVELLHEAAPRELGKIDMSWAADISRRAAVSPCALMLAMVYIERLRHRDPQYLQQVASSDLFLISMMVASKYLYDEGVTEEVFNEEWAEAAHMDVCDINQMEREFLSASDWQLYVRADQFFQELTAMEKRIALDEWNKHGVSTYTDLTVLMSGADWSHVVTCLLQTLTEVVAVCSVAYVAGVLTLLLSPSALTLARSSIQQAPPPIVITTPPSVVTDNNLDAVTNETDVKLEMEEEDDNNKTRRGLTAGGFLPLVLIRDTVLAFVIGNQPDLKTGDNDQLGYQAACSCSDDVGSSQCSFCKLHHDPSVTSDLGMDDLREHELDKYSWHGQCRAAINWFLSSDLPTELQSSFGNILLGFKTMPASAAAAG